VLDPDNGYPFLPRLLDKVADVRDDRVALGSSFDDAVLHVDDEECGVRPVLECGHGLPFLKLESRNLSCFIRLLAVVKAMALYLRSWVRLAASESTRHGFLFRRPVNLTREVARNGVGRSERT
jgi:hypothetical protein